MRKKLNLVTLVCVLLSILLGLTLLCTGGCSSHTEPDVSKLKILHINDVHSHLDPATLDLHVGGQHIRCEAGGMAGVAALIHDYRSADSELLVLHAGDAVQGTLYSTLFNGDADAEVMNAIGFDAMCIGNHEFDHGDIWLADFLTQLQMPILSANINVEPGNPLAGLYQAYITTDVNGHTIGIIGVTIVKKTVESSFPGPQVQFEDEVLAIQQAAQALMAAGVGRILVLSHYGYEHAIELASRVSGIDAIIDGDSHTLLGDFSTYGLESGGPYPTVATNADGDPVCIVQAWEYAKAVGELNLTIAGDAVVDCSGTPYLVLGENFSAVAADGSSIPLTPAQLEVIHAAIAADPQLRICPHDPQVARIIAAYAAEIEAEAKRVIGSAAAYLPHIRVPVPETGTPEKSGGSQIAPLVAHAFYTRVPDADMALINAGALRTDLYPGAISIESINTLMPFAATLVSMQISGTEIRQALEDGIENIAQGGSSGSFPYAYGIRYAVDATQQHGARITQLEFRSRTAATFVPIQDESLYTLVTNSYVAAGKDGYATMADTCQRRGCTDTFIDVTQALVDYIEALTRAGLEVEALPPEEYCIKHYTPTPDSTDNL